MVTYVDRATTTVVVSHLPPLPPFPPPPSRFKHDSQPTYFTFLILCAGTNVPNSSQRSDGYYTVGMQDINFNMPDNRIIGCAAACGDLTYPDAIPGPDSPISIS